MTPVPSNSSILVVDDAPDNLHILVRFLTAQGYKTRAARNGTLALQSAEETPPDLVLLDIVMPGMDGFEVCRRFKTNDKLKDIPIIFLSALDEIENKVSAFSAGGVDYVTKPFHFDEVKARVTSQMRLRELTAELEERNRRLQDLVRQHVREISDSQMATIFALAKLAEARDDDTGQHLERVQMWCELLAARCRPKRPRTETDGLFAENIVRACALHDIGKVGIRDCVLLKPGKLTPEEFDEMKTHTTLGARTLEAVEGQYPKNAFVSMGVEIARWHHERWDGTGYPDGLSGTDIPLSARIVAVADAYDAMCSNRCYRPRLSHEQARDTIVADSGSHFDPDVVEAFRGLETEFKSRRENARDGL